MSKSQHKPFFSILLSVYNQEKYLSDCLKSISSQTFKKYQLVIIDDASTDSCPQIIKQWKTQYRQITHLTNKNNIGLTKSLNLAANKAIGKYLARIDADDMWKKNKLQDQYNYLQNSQCTILGTQANVINFKGDVIGNSIVPLRHDEIISQLPYSNPFFHSSVVIERNAFTKSGGYNHHFYRSQDYELWLRLINSAKFHNLNTFLLSRRLSGDNISAKSWKEQLKFSIQARQLHRNKFPNSIKFKILLQLQKLQLLLLPSFTKKIKRKLFN